MVPRALYGLDHPKIPASLIDFRDGVNPKRRELTRLILRDMAKNVLPLSTMGHVMFFLARTPYDWITGRRGMDMNQPSRLRSYSELNRSEEHTSELQSHLNLVCRLLLQKKDYDARTSS